MLGSGSLFLATLVAKLWSRLTDSSSTTGSLTFVVLSDAAEKLLDRLTLKVVQISV